MLAYIFLLLALRSYLLAVVEKKPKTAKIIDGCVGTLALALFLALPRDFQWKPLAVIAGLIAFSLYFRLSRKDRKFSFQTFATLTSLYVFGAFAALASLFFRMTEETKLGKVVLTGKTQKEWVTWKSPGKPQPESAWLDTYEVVIEDVKGNELSREFVYGDLVSIRAETITIEWPLHLLGFSNLCHLEMVYNGYTTAQRHSFLPHKAFALPFPLKAFQLVWEKLYRGEWKVPGVKNGTLESVYFPLVTSDLKPNENSYWLTSSTLKSIH